MIIRGMLKKFRGSNSFFKQRLKYSKLSQITKQIHLHLRVCLGLRATFLHAVSIGLSYCSFIFWWFAI
jgi:hypothetical protein